MVPDAASPASPRPQVEDSRANLIVRSLSAPFDRSRQVGVAASALFHGIIIIALLINWRHLSHDGADNLPNVVPVELVAVTYETNMRAMIAQQRRGPPSDDPSPPAPQSVAAQQFEMHLFPQAVSDTPTKQPLTADDNETVKTQVQGSDPKGANIGNYDIKPVGKANAMTMSVSDALRNQIARCWKPTPEGRESTVTVSLVLDAAGAIERPPQFFVPAAFVATDPSIEAIRYAIYTCAPYKLPANRFIEWHSITLKFASNP